MAQSQRDFEDIVDQRTKFESMPEPSEWMTSTQGYKLAVRRWHAVKEMSASPKSVVILQHGGGFHSGYFNEVGSALSLAGYEVVAMDAMGHGYSEGPGELTYWDDIAEVTDDLSKLAAREKHRVGKIPVVVYAESMGALIAAPLAIKCDENISAYIIGGGLFKLAPQTAPPGPFLFLMRQLARFFPRRRVQLPTLDATFDSAFGDKRWAEAARSDPKVVTNAFFLCPAA